MHRLLLRPGVRRCRSWTSRASWTCCGCRCWSGRSAATSSVHRATTRTVRRPTAIATTSTRRPKRPHTTATKRGSIATHSSASSHRTLTVCWMYCRWRTGSASSSAGIHGHASSGVGSGVVARKERKRRRESRLRRRSERKQRRQSRDATRRQRASHSNSQRHGRSS